MHKLSYITLSALVVTTTCLFSLPCNPARAQDQPTAAATAELKNNEIVLYDDYQSKGEGDRVKRIIVTDTKPNVVNSLRDLQFNDALSSLRWNLAPGIEVTFDENGDGKGRDYKISGKGENANLKEQSFNNIASAFRWTRTESKEAK